MRALVAAVVSLGLAGCLSSSDDPTKPDPSTALSYDAHFIQLIPPYATPEDCFAAESPPFICQMSLSLCKSGRAGERVGDLVYDGAYDMVGSVAHVSFRNGAPLQFDVEAVAEIGSPNAHWIIDTERRWETLQFDNIGCDQP